MKQLPFLFALALAACSGSEAMQEADADPAPVPEQAAPDTTPTTPVLPAATMHSNQRFRDVTVEKVGDHAFLVQGSGQIFEASFGWVVEDGHDELQKGFEMTDASAPDWGKFKFTVDVEKTRPNSTLTLILFETSAQDGSRQYELPVVLY